MQQAVHINAWSVQSVSTLCADQSCIYTHTCPEIERKSDSTIMVSHVIAEFWHSVELGQFVLKPWASSAGPGYRVVPAHRNWQIETAGWNWAGFFTECLEPRWQRFGQFLNDL